jgi:predicted membrane-bound mannosyltransferase
VAFWTLGVTAAYSLVPYKTPWLALNILLPLALLAGYALDLVARRWPWVAGVLLLPVSTIALQRSVDLNFKRYDDDRLPYVYAHTQRGFLDVVQAVDRIAAMSGRGQSMMITITAREHWPLPWYLRSYRMAGYQDNMQAARQSVLVIANLDQDERLKRELGPEFDRLGTYPLRPGVTMVLFVQTRLLSGRPGL